MSGKESKKQLKARVLKEKKERRKKKDDTSTKADSETKPGNSEHVILESYRNALLY